MAIILRGMTVCPLCNQVIGPEDEVEGLPPTPSQDHPLYRYFDCGFHAQCFESWDGRAEARRLADNERRQGFAADFEGIMEDAIRYVERKSTDVVADAWAARLRLARRAKEMGISVSRIAGVTGLSEAEVSEL